MDTTIRNLDETAYRALRSQAVLQGRTVGDLINELMRSYLRKPEIKRERTSLRDLTPDLSRMAKS